LTFDDWLGAGRQISTIASASAWWLGDWLNYGERTYGQRYRTALDLTPFDYKTLRNYAWVARRVEMSRRRDNLSFQHHAEVAALPEAEQDLWLRRAEKLRWSRNRLRGQLTQHRRASRAEEADHSVVLRVEVAAEREHAWREAAIRTRQELTEWLATVADEAATATLAEVPHATELDRRRDAPTLRRA
jgi:hypothetical protein